MVPQPLLLDLLVLFVMLLVLIAPFALQDTHFLRLLLPVDHKPVLILYAQPKHNPHGTQQVVQLVFQLEQRLLRLLRQLLLLASNLVLSRVQVVQ